MKPIDEMSESEKVHFLECWERLRDGVASEAEVKEIHARLGKGEGAKRWLAEAILLETELRFDGESLKSQSKSEPLIKEVEVKGWRVSRWSHAAAAAVAALLSWGVWQATQVPAAAVATLVKAQSCKWGNSALPTLEGSALAPDRKSVV